MNYFEEYHFELGDIIPADELGITLVEAMVYLAPHCLSIQPTAKGLELVRRHHVTRWKFWKDTGLTIGNCGHCGSTIAKGDEDKDPCPECNGDGYTERQIDVDDFESIPCHCKPEPEYDKYDAELSAEITRDRYGGGYEG